MRPYQSIRHCNLFNQFETRRLLFKKVSLAFKNKHKKLFLFSLLSVFPRFSSVSKFHQFCFFTKKPRSVFRLFKMSRIVFREFAHFGKINGLTKSSW